MLSANSSLRVLLTASAVTIVLCVSTAASEAASGFRVLHAFQNRDGAYPQGGAPTVDSAGNVYLPTHQGGRFGYGTVVRIAPDKKRTVLHAFKGSDGQYPSGGVLYEESDGKIFGTTCVGGANGYGVVYELDSDGGYKILHSFDGTSDGSCPWDAPVRDSTTGNFYGVSSTDVATGYGLVWKLTPKGDLTVLHAFNGSDGGNPYARLIVGKRGILYGTTASGGAYNYGTLYSITSKGKFANLHDFDNVNDGAYPQNFLTQDGKGNLYGTAYSGGVNGAGTVYKLTPDGTFSVIHSFTYNGVSIGYTQSNVVLVKNKLYGTLMYGGDGLCQCGGVFVVGMDGSADILHNFTGQDYGITIAGLAPGPNGFLYGDTASGGKGDYGTVFQLKP